MTDQELTVLEALCKKAMPGPWVALSQVDPWGENSFGVYHRKDGKYESVDCDISSADAAFYKEVFSKR
jgi:hypothetical protein